MYTYSDKVINRFNNPKFTGKLDEKKKNVGVGEVGSLSCGDILRVYFQFNSDNIVEDVRILVFGCGSALAASERMAEIAMNKSIHDLLSISNKEISKFLELPKIKYHCSVLAEEAIHKAVRNYCSKNNILTEEDGEISFEKNKKEDSQKKCCEEICETTSENNFKLDKSLDFELSLSQSAKEILKDFFEKNINKALKISLVKKGCGFTYTYYICEKLPIETNKYWIFELNNTFIYVQRNTYLKNIKIDIIENGIEKVIKITSEEKHISCSCGMTFK